MSDQARIKLGNDTYASFIDGMLTVWNESGHVTVEPEQLARLLKQCGPFQFSVSPEELNGMWWLEKDDHA